MSLREFSHLVDPRLRRVLDHWLAIRDGRALPERRRIDPVALAPLLPFLWICEAEPVGGGFRYRLAGEEINGRSGGNLRGRDLVETFPPERRPHVAANLERLSRERVAVHMIGAVYCNRDRYDHGERLMLPLGDDGEIVDGILGITVCDRALAGIPYGGEGPPAMTVTFTPVPAAAEAT